MNHRYRESLVHDRTALANRIRGYLREMGIFVVQGLSALRKQVPSLREDATNELTGDMRTIISSCYDKLVYLDQEIKQYTKKIEQFCEENDLCKRLMKLSGIGPMSASIIFR
ncbi:hypothetical protein Lsan_1820 [Legionella santicrucis]|uniref:Transposase n=1 Tax=Legionella santicrucis TaxID=45074 RepID=A0A0W0YYL2_9GAMM|nr:IS110 family transposase [Legionella santicrucis]KTD61977.1 hypothetical protein Lsan_1820 [Legionella santicrucis]